MNIPQNIVDIIDSALDYDKRYNEAFKNNDESIISEIEKFMVDVPNEFDKVLENIEDINTIVKINEKLQDNMRCCSTKQMNSTDALCSKIARHITRAGGLRKYFDLANNAEENSINEQHQQNNPRR